mgnify:CR=1 FL=1
MQSASISSFQENEQPDLPMNISTLLASVISIFLLSSCGQQRGCHFQVINQDHDSSSSQKIFDEVDENGYVQLHVASLAKKEEQAIIQFSTKKVGSAYSVQSFPCEIISSCAKFAGFA